MIGKQPKPNSDEWFTPRWILDRLGNFDLDPCTAKKRPWSNARINYTQQDDGLKQKWFGRVWLNPPYSQLSWWLERLSEHDNGIALCFARTETKTFFDHVWDKAVAVCFIQGRVTFCNNEGELYKWNCGAPSVLIAYGKENISYLKDFPGKCIIL